MRRTPSPLSAGRLRGSPNGIRREPAVTCPPLGLVLPSSPRPFSRRPRPFLRSPSFFFRSSFFVLRSSIFALRSSLFALRSSFFALRSSFFALRSSLFVLRSSLFVLRSSLSAAAPATRRESVLGALGIRTGVEDTHAGHVAAVRTPRNGPPRELETRATRVEEDAQKKEWRLRWHCRRG